MRSIPEPDSFLANLTEAQKQAVLHTEGPLLILAGPGSGKTRVITCRVGNLVRQGIRPYQILAITFTNKAAGEMRQRIENLMPGSASGSAPFTASASRLMRQYADRLGLDRNFTIYDQADRVRLVKIALEAAGIDHVPLYARGSASGHQQGQESAAAAGKVRLPGQRLFQPGGGPRLSGL